MSFMISVIIPTYNEAANIQLTIDGLNRCKFSDIEIIVVDGGSQDETTAIAAQCGATVLISNPGRAAQMNAGAAIAQGSILLFLHADTAVPKGFDQWIQAGLDDAIAGAFDLKIDGDRWLLRGVEWGVAVRSRVCQLPYGDQGIFLKADTFYHLGGFPELPIMEDFVFMRTLRKKGRIAIVPAAVLTSARRWQAQGIWQTTFMNQVMIVGFYLGVKPDRLRAWYRSGVR
ncbi:MAG: TIGR04283 family arsenosugar biosynthesis glycosyltransferase [Alkalinema sp. FL-bin-369]|nr:TIGR04283 family arsenosugar biosynthesis glycosyltransferase [Leptolyngbyaceae cyanobacterium LF-bin-369]